MEHTLKVLVGLRDSVAFETELPTVVEKESVQRMTVSSIRDPDDVSATDLESMPWLNTPLSERELSDQAIRIGELTEQMVEDLKGMDSVLIVAQGNDEMPVIVALEDPGEFSRLVKQNEDLVHVDWEISELGTAAAKLDFRQMLAVLKAKGWLRIEPDPVRSGWF